MSFRLILETESHLSNNRVRRGLGVVLLGLSIAAAPVFPIRPLFALGVAALALIPVLVRDSSLRLPIVLLFLGSLVSLFSVIANEVPLSSFPAMTLPRLLIYFCAIWLVQKVFVLKWGDLLFGSLLGVSTYWVQVSDKESFASIWKYCIGVAVSVAVLLILEKWTNNRMLLLLAGLVLVTLSLVLASRTLALQVSLAILIWLMSNRKVRPTPSTATLQLGALFATIVLAVEVISRLGSAGFFGELLQRSFRGNSGRSANLILGGRSELPISFGTISQRPILGYGQTPEPDTSIFNSAYDFALRMGININSATYRVWVNPATGEVTPHSMIFETWIESGLVAFLLVLALLFFGIRFLCRIVLGKRVQIAVLLLLIVLLWDAVFSPFLTGRDILYALMILLCFSIRGTEWIDGPQNVSSSGPLTGEKGG